MPEPRYPVLRLQFAGREWWRVVKGKTPMTALTLVGGIILGWWQGDVVTLTGLQGKILGAVGLPLVLAALFFVVKWLAAAGTMWREKEEEIRALHLRLVEAECRGGTFENRLNSALRYLTELEVLFKAGGYRRIAEVYPITQVLESAVNRGAVNGAGARDLDERKVALLRIARERESQTIKLPLPP